MYLWIAFFRLVDSLLHLDEELADKFNSQHGLILAYSQNGSARFVFSVSHSTEFYLRLFKWAATMGAAKSSSFVIWAASLHVDFVFCAMADVCLVALYQVFGQFIKLVEMITAVRYLVRLKPKPCHLDQISQARSKRAPARLTMSSIALK